MKKLLVVLITGLALLSLAVVPAVAGKNGPAGKSNVAHLYLYEKVPSGEWPILDGGAWGKMKYNLEGPEFCFVFNGHGLEPNTDYSLIYYADPWPGNGLTGLAGALIASGTTNRGGNIHLGGCEDLETDLPHSDDANASFTSPPCAGYPCPGAKIWLVLSDDYHATQPKMIAWNPADYLFEYELISYTDTDAP